MDSCHIRCFGKARSLLSDRAGRALGHYVPTELGSSSVHVRSLRSDRAWLVRVSIGTLELIPGWFRYVSVTLGQLVFDPTETRTRFYLEVLCLDTFFFIKHNCRRETLTLVFTEVWTLTSS